MSENKNDGSFHEDLTRVENEEKEEDFAFEHADEEIEEAEHQEGADEVTKLKNEVAKLKESLLRNAADFENYKKRKDEEVSRFAKYASEKVLQDLLPVYDDISRSVESINKGETKDFETLKKGIELIHEKFKNVLDSEGVEEINSLGKPFDFNVSNALMQVPRDDVEPNTVIEVVEKGYKLKDKVIKHEKVFVSAKPE